MKKLTTAIIMSIMMFTGCLEGQINNKTFEPYYLGSLHLTYPVTVDSSWDNYLNRDKTINEYEKMESAQAVFEIVYNRFIPDPEPYPEDVWRELKLHDMKGDCEDFALSCRALLLSQHWLDGDVILLSSGTHLVCGVIINGNIYILDNLASRVAHIDDSDYEWLDVLHNNKWFNVGDE